MTKHVSPWSEPAVEPKTTETASAVTEETAASDKGTELPREYVVGEHGSKRTIPVLAQLSTKTVWPVPNN